MFLCDLTHYILSHYQFNKKKMKRLTKTPVFSLFVPMLRKLRKKKQRMSCQRMSFGNCIVLPMSSTSLKSLMVRSHILAM